MSFRPRRQVLGQVGVTTAPTGRSPNSAFAEGVRPSPLDGRPTVSTGTRSLDSLLAGHSGLALGNLLLIEENGTTDFSGCLLKYYAAEGALQGHQVHVLGMPETWGRELPDISTQEKAPSKSYEPAASERMKIAWRYERLGGSNTDARVERQISQGNSTSTFCHDFDLTKRLTLSSYSNLHFVPIRPILSFGDLNCAPSPFSNFLDYLTSRLENSSPSTIHRVVIPNLLSPALYVPDSSKPQTILPFFHALRAFTRRYPTQVTIMATFPLTLYPRSTGLTRWIEILCDGVIELSPFASTKNSSTVLSGATHSQEDPPQGIVKLLKLPVFHEKGGGSGEKSGYNDNLAFTLHRRKGMVIKPFSLPPLEEDEGKDRSQELDMNKIAKEDLEF
ncbi:PAXNEB protein superfamily [Blumeria hordei DH14]|uniref:Elongator complex protein 4 n=1 Tax=Blumeria graminis f. sp. hordei (strain DH14) TaxID=546991 RepID=N1J6Q5_BLUG1|nr:PAXNEB protein superfamily [Blumeria hordei DH14]